MWALETDEQLISLTHLKVTVEGQLTHSHDEPDIWGHHTVIDLQSLNPDAPHLSLKDFASLELTVLYWYASWPLPLVSI